MASKVTIDSQLGDEAKSSASLSANTQKLRALADKAPGFRLIAENFANVQQSLDRLERGLRRNPNVSKIEIDSADILNLVVGGRNGPGQITILSGPPSYTRIGFDGTEETEIVFTISTVSGATVNTTVEHSLLPGDQVRIQGNSSINHLGYWEIDTVPTDTSFTLLNPPTGSGTAGTVTFLYAGGWRKTFAIGGEGFDSAPFFGNVAGQIFIGKNGSITLLDTLAQEKGFIGVVEEAPQNITAFANNGSGLFRMTVVGHGYETGDDVVVEGLGDFAVTKITNDTFDLQDSTFGAYTLGEVYRYRGPFWGQSIAGGGTGYEDATFRTYRNGMRLGAAGGPRLEFDGATGELSLTDASITLSGTSLGDDFLLTLDASTIQVENIADGSKVMLSGGYVYMENPSLTPDALALFNATNLQLSRVGSGFWDNSFIVAGADEGFLTTWVNNSGVDCYIDGSTGHAHFVSLSLDSALTGYYTSGQVDALIANLQTQINTKSAIGHTHSTISITGTAGGGVAPHTHTGSAS